MVKKVKESRKRPGVAQRVPGVLDSQISIGHVKVVSASLTGRLYSQILFLVLIFPRV
jgi:hypothetical protein